MVNNINEIAKALGAKRIGQVPKPGGGAFGAARVAQDANALSQADKSEATDSGFIGAMSDASEELDIIVRDAMRARWIQSWQPSPEGFSALESLVEATGQPLNILLDEALRLLLQQWNQKCAGAESQPASQSRRAALHASEAEALAFIDAAADVPEEVWTEWPHNPDGIDLGTADMSDPKARKKLMEELGRRMSRLSESASCAGWMRGLENRVPALCNQAVQTGKIQPFGGTVVCPGLAARLLAMRDKLGHWVVPAMEGGYEPYLPPEKQ